MYKLSLAVFIALLLLACTREDVSKNSQPTPAPAAQEVQLIEYAIRMPDTVPAGRYAFQVENAGKEDHGFEIEGNGIEQKTDILKRGDVTSLDVELKPGTYTVYCPVKGHKEKGMRKTVTVHQ
jgi:uncharacterized cupredoxin-like copper-binding protein